MNKPIKNTFIQRYTIQNKMVKARLYKRSEANNIMRWHKSMAYGGWARRGDIYTTHGDIYVVDERRIEDGEWLVCSSGNTIIVKNAKFHELYYPLYHYTKKYIDRMVNNQKSGDVFEIGDAPHIHAKD